MAKKWKQNYEGRWVLVDDTGKSQTEDPNAPHVSRLPDQKQVDVPPQTDWARSWLQNLISGGVPKLPGMTDIEEWGQSLLGGLVLDRGMPEGYELGMDEIRKTLGGGYDPRTSPFYESLREEAKTIKSEGVSDIRRASQRRGMLASTPSMRTEGEFTASIDRGLLSELGGLLESERGRQMGAMSSALGYAGLKQQQPLSKLAAISQYGGLPRELETQKTMFPYQVLSQLAGLLASQPYIPADLQQWLVRYKS